MSALSDLSSASASTQSDSKKPRTGGIITDDDYIEWLIKEYPKLERFETILVSSRTLFLSLAAVPDTVTAESLSQLASPELLWPTSVLLNRLQADQFFDKDPSDRSTFTFVGRSGQHGR